MSLFRNHYTDLPQRVCRVWQKIRGGGDGLGSDLSVTAALMAAATGLAMPLEDIYVSSDSKKRMDHPNFDVATSKEYQESVDLFCEFLKEPFASSVEFKSASFFRVKDLGDIRDVVETLNDGKKIDISKNKLQRKDAIFVFRNALAHNNFATFGAGDKIEKIAFFSDWKNKAKEKIGYNVLLIRASDFVAFLDSWFEKITEYGYCAAVEASSLAVGDS